MPDTALVTPLEADWRPVLDAVARGQGFPTTAEPARLAPRLAALSAAYNDRDGAGVEDLGPEALAARLLFSFPRDVPKAAGAVRELVAAGLLRLDAKRPLQVLDVGAGLGATTWGVARALGAAGQRGLIQAVWTDADGKALELARAVLGARHRAGDVVLEARTLATPVGAKAP